MSLDGFVECKACKQHLAAALWIQVFASFSMARLHGLSPEFLSALTPGPGLIKVEVCFGCQTFRPSMDFTDKEKVEMGKYKDEQEKAAKVGETFGKLFGGFRQGGKI